MFKRVFQALTALAGIGMSTVAGAVPVSFTDTVNPEDIFFKPGRQTSAYVLVHDIRDDGFNPLTDTLTRLTLRLRFRDDADSQAEAVTINFDNALEKGFSIRSGSCACSPSVILQELSTELMQKDGLLKLALTRKRGDFWFMDSNLVATAERGPVPTPGGGQVPEPEGGLLTGLALLGAGVLRRRRVLPSRFPDRP